MLTELRIDNFKSWKSTGPIRLAPLTVFCGTNSSGKSSIAQFILMLKQTVESYDRQRVLHTGDGSSMVDLGSWLDIVHGHDESKAISFSFNYHDVNGIAFSDPVNEKMYGPFNQVGFNAKVEYDRSVNRIVLDHFTYQLPSGKPEDPGNPDINLGLKIKDVSRNQYELIANGFGAMRQQGRPGVLPHPENFFGFPGEAIAYYQNTGFLTDFSLSVKNLFKSVFYVGPLREYPERFYQFSGEMPPDVGTRGRLSVNAMLAAGQRSISRGRRKKGESFQILIARWLKTMKLIEDFRLAPIADGRKEYEVRIKVQKGAPEVLITDVGFGISQVLPVLVQCFYVPSNSTILFEQPEIHLHPSVQAYLADMFIEAIHAYEDSKPRHTQLIIESHSEHLIRRLQRKIAEEELKLEDVAIYFVDQKKGISTIEALEIDEFGNILNWPDNFFGDDLEDLTAMALKGIERKRKMSGNGIRS
jgi:predicted ATPase